MAGTISSRSCTFVSRSYYDVKGTNSIGWCGSTNPYFRGCSPVSEACRFCYAAAEGIHQIKLRGGASPYAELVETRKDIPTWTGKVVPSGLESWLRPLRMKTPALIFANSMSDPFHEAVTDAAVVAFLEALRAAPWHVFQILTKRPARMEKVMSRLVEVNGQLTLVAEPVQWDERALVPNVWFGVTVENQRCAEGRIPHLQRVKAVVRFLSVEPMLGEVNLSQHLLDLDWVICGGESAPDFRPMDANWVRSLREQCSNSGTAFFFKQWAGKSPARLSKELDGELVQQLPRRDLFSVPPDRDRKARIENLKSIYAQVFRTDNRVNETV